MSIQVVTAAPSTKLTTRNTVKALLNMTGNPADDDLIDDMIQAASDFVCNYTGRMFAKQRVIETIAGRGTPLAILSLAPIVTLHEGLYRGAAMTDVSINDPRAGIIFRPNGFTSTNIPANMITLNPTGYYDDTQWSINYTGGYVLPGWDSSFGARTLPYDLERAVVDMVKVAYHKKGIDPSASSYRIGETQIAWRAPSTDGGAVEAAIPASILSVLNYYKSSI